SRISPRQPIARVCSPAGISRVNRSVTVSAALSYWGRSAAWSSTLALWMSRSSECRTISREGRASRMAMRSVPTEDQSSKSSWKWSSYRLGSTSLVSRKLRRSWLTRTSPAKRRAYLLRSPDAAPIHLHDVSTEKDHPRVAAGDPPWDHAGVLSRRQDRRSRPERRRQEHSPADHGGRRS